MVNISNIVEDSQNDLGIFLLELFLAGINLSVPVVLHVRGMYVCVYVYFRQN